MLTPFLSSSCSVSSSAARYAPSSSSAAASFYTFDVAGSAGGDTGLASHACMHSVDLAQNGAGAASIKAMVASPFKSLTSFIPRVWSAPAVPERRGAEESDSSSARRSGGYVSREKQLRKLQMRMQVEGAASMGRAFGVPCRSCDGASVSI